MPADSNLYAEFYLHPVLDSEKSKEQDRPIYNDVVYIEIKIKGQKNSSFSRPKNKQDELDFPENWAAFSQSDEQIKSGTPIKAIPGVTPSVEIELKTYGIKTVEDLADLNDAGIMAIRGGRHLQTRAKAYLAAASILPEKSVRPEVLGSIEPVDVKEMQAMGAIPSPKRGRPRKNATG